MKKLATAIIAVLLMAGSAWGATLAGVTLTGVGVNNDNGVDNYTKLLLHMDGTDDAQVFTDSSEFNHTITANYDAKTEDTQKKFGPTSGYFDGTQDNLSVPNSSDWVFGTGDFTIDAWVYYSALPSSPMVIVAYYNGANRVWTLDSSTTNGLYTNRGAVDGSYVESYSNAWEMAVDTWYHVAMVRNGNELKYYVDGTQIGSTHNVTGDEFFSQDIALTVGTLGNFTEPFNGYIDELRISKGIARWTANFTPPTRAYGR